MSKKNQHNSYKKNNWQPLIELFVVLATVVGTTVPLYIHTDSKMMEHRKETNEILEAIRQDIRDFHGRLCAIEERNKK